MILNILVDYDNLSPLHQKRGLSDIVNSIISKFSKSEIEGITNLNFRLYGGWYNKSNLTKKAQKLITDINSNFPKIFTIPCNMKNVIVKIELAYSLLISPKEHLFNTYRKRGYPVDLECSDPIKYGCTDPNCPVRYVYEFIDKKSIKNQCCSIKPENIIFRGQQKLVDTMLCSDIIFLCINYKNKIIVLVSSDDDFWPSVKMSLELGARILQLHTKGNRKLPYYYNSNANSHFIEKIL